MTLTSSPRSATEPTGGHTPGGPKSSPTSWARSAVLRPEFGVLVACVALYGFFVVFAGANGFVSQQGSAGWIDSAAEIGVVAIPVAALLIAGEFDLSIGSVIGAASMVTAIGSGHYGLPLGVSVLLALAFGALVGLFNGVVTLVTGLGSFIVTLATMMAVAGLTLGTSRLVAGTTTISLESDGLLHTLFAGTIGPLSATVVWWVAVAVVGTWVLSATVFGNWVYATGGDFDAALTNGVPVRRVKCLLFIGSSLGASLVGILQTVQFSSGDVSRGQAFIFNAIAAAVIGGVLLTGGYGSPIGVSLGAATYGIVSMGIYYTGWSTDWVQLFLGSLVLLAVLGNNYFRRLALSAGRGTA